MLCLGLGIAVQSAVADDHDDQNATSREEFAQEFIFGSESIVGTLLREAEEQENAILALAAAELISESPGGVLLPDPEAADDKSAAEEFAKLDAKSTPAVARRALDRALDLAKEISPDDELVKSRVEALRNAQTKQFSSTCYTYNDLGAWFYWTAPSRGTARRSAMRACRANTPFGYYCYHSHCD
jgi:hypothetical protein